MTIWLDAQLSPRLAPWIAEHFQLDARSLRWLRLRDEKDDVIFRAAREANVIILTKDSDFCELLDKHGSPPKIIWLTCGNCHNADIQRLLTRYLASALTLLENGEDLIEIGNLQC
jgi:predicted nuclease of predicted toxin-antitoxin system